MLARRPARALALLAAGTGVALGVTTGAPGAPQTATLASAAAALPAAPVAVPAAAPAGADSEVRGVPATPAPAAAPLRTTRTVAPVAAPAGVRTAPAGVPVVGATGEPSRPAAEAAPAVTAGAPAELGLAASAASAAAAPAVQVLTQAGEVPRIYDTSSPPDPYLPHGPLDRTVFGMSVAPRDDETAATAVRRVTGQFGRLPVVRAYSRGLPPLRWSDDGVLRALPAGTAIVYSFKGDMEAAAQGAYDDRLRSFLGSRPVGTTVWVTLNHEPEDDVERGHFTPAQFRAATTHLAPVVRDAGGIPTVILMQYTLTRGSGRDWHDYYTPAVDALGWDAYNTSAGDDAPSYKPAARFVEPVLEVARETGKPFGWAELGSPCIRGDADCSGRAAWLGSLADAFDRAGAQFATYWNRPDFAGGFDYGLHDQASIDAWRSRMQR